MWAVRPFMLVVALAEGAKSPPEVSHSAVSKDRWVQLGSPGWASAPAPEPSLPKALTDPSRHSLSTR